MDSIDKVQDDEKVLKALQCFVTSLSGNCPGEECLKECQYYGSDTYTTEDLFLNAIAIIKHLQSENAAYKSTGLTPEQVKAEKENSMTLTERVAELIANRDAWRRRADAAEEDMRIMSSGNSCDVCKCDAYSEICRSRVGESNISGNDCFEWRGPRDESKEESE